jgi:predicted transcriptional regulator
MPKKNTTKNPAGLNREETREVAQDVVAEAIRDQARELEKHLKSIHERLQALEIRG